MAATFTPRVLSRRWGFLQSCARALPCKRLYSRLPDQGGRLSGNTPRRSTMANIKEAATATIMGAVKFVGPLLFFVTSLFCMVNSYPDLDLSHIGCNECALKKNDFFSRDKPVYQCKGCCFSMAYPTPHWIKKLMMNPKNITSEAACCTARSSELVKVQNLMVRNHTECYCDTCIYHKI
uniref:Glycoprotein hormones alpha chain n=2 Tax=Hippocampus comes TaxID=109280 RepID=A0A3Q3DGN4_HIPCM